MHVIFSEKFLFRFFFFFYGAQIIAIYAFLVCQQFAGGFLRAYMSSLYTITVILRT